MKNEKIILIIASNATSLLLFRYELMESFFLQGYAVYALAPKDQITEEITLRLSKIGVQLCPYLINNRGVNPFFDIKTLFTLYQAIKRIRPNIVLNYTIKPVIYASIIAYFAKVPQIFSIVTGLGSLFIRQTVKISVMRYFACILYRIAFYCNQQVFFQNPDDQYLFINQHMIPAAKTVLLNGSGVNLVYFKQQPIINQQHFLFIGRLLRDKGIFEFIAATKKVQEKYPSAEFTVIGPLQHNAETQLILATLKQTNIHYIQEVSDVRPYIQACSVYVLPSYREGTPRSVLEAMAMGRAIITTDAPGCRETVQNGINGFLVPVQDIDMLTEKMLFFLQNPDQVLQMGEQSRLIVQKKYDVYQVNQKIIDIMMK